MSSTEDELFGRVCDRGPRRAVVAPQRRRALRRARSFVVLAAVRLRSPRCSRSSIGPPRRWRSRSRVCRRARPLCKRLAARVARRSRLARRLRQRGVPDRWRSEVRPRSGDGVRVTEGRGRPQTLDVRGRSSQLAWRSGPLSMWVRDRAASSSLHTTARVLGTTAQVLQYRGRADTGRHGAVEVRGTGDGVRRSGDQHCESRPSFEHCVGSPIPGCGTATSSENRCWHRRDQADARRHSATTRLRDSQIRSSALIRTAASSAPLSRHHRVHLVDDWSRARRAATRARSSRRSTRWPPRRDGRSCLR